jgi:hypothetical protein
LPPAYTLREECLALAGHGADARGILFCTVKNNVTSEVDRLFNANSVYRDIVQKYGLETGVSARINRLCVRSLRASTATNSF